ncbi:methyltransferase [Listeria monocytogenes]|nr:methyltransferase [Listeria monocytogenes]
MLSIISFPFFYLLFLVGKSRCCVKTYSDNLLFNGISNTNLYTSSVHSIFFFIFVSSLLHYLFFFKLFSLSQIFFICMSLTQY